MGLRLPTVDKFLCCCELQTGVLLVGVLSLLGALCGCLGASIALSLSALGTAAAGGAFGQFNFTRQDASLSQEQKEAISNLGLGLTGNAQQDTTTVLAWTTAMMAILLIICIGYVVVASMLIHGARKVTEDEHFG